MKNIDEIIKNNIINSWKYKLPNINGYRTFQEFMDINNLSEDNINEDAINFYYTYNINHTYNRPQISYIELFESLKSYSGEKLINKLKDFSDIVNINNDIHKEKIFTIILELNIINNICEIDNNNIGNYNYKNTNISKKFKSIINLYGYYITYVFIENNKLIVYLEPISTRNIYNEIKNEGGILYHITERRFLNNILKLGLIPKTKDYRYYPEKLFFIRNNKNKEQLKNEIINILNDKHINKPDQYIILKINISKKEINIYLDTSYEDNNKVFTYEPINPKLITPILNINKL